MRLYRPHARARALTMVATAPTAGTTDGSVLAEPFTVTGPAFTAQHDCTPYGSGDTIDWTDAIAAAHTAASLMIAVRCDDPYRQTPRAGAPSPDRLRPVLCNTDPRHTDAPIPRAHVQCAPVWTGGMRADDAA